MNDLDILRRDHVALIAEAPVEITVHRVIYMDDGAGGRMKQESDLPAFTGRLVPSRQSAQSYRNEAGDLYVSGWTLLAPWDADLKASSDETDTFIVGDRTYRVARVMPRAYQGEPYAIHALLEEVG